MNPVENILGTQQYKPLKPLKRLKSLKPLNDISRNKVLELTNDEKKRYDNISQRVRDRQVNLQCSLCGNTVLASTYGPIKTIYYSRERILQLKGRCNKCKRNVDGGYNLTHDEFLLEKEFKSKKYESYTIKIRSE